MSRWLRDRPIGRSTAAAAPISVASSFRDHGDQLSAPKRDGVQLNGREAADLAHDHRRASELAKYMIFSSRSHGTGRLCSRKIGLRDQMAHIKTPSMRAQVR